LEAYIFPGRPAFLKYRSRQHADRISPFSSDQTTNEYIREEMTRLLHTNHIYTLDSHGWIDADTYDPEMVGHTMNQLDSLSWRFLDAAMNSPSPPQLATFRRKKQVFGQGVWPGWHKTRKLAG
jgi:hypothetical protein